MQLKKTLKKPKKTLTKQSLKVSRYNKFLEYIEEITQSKPKWKSTKRRNIIWFNPPFCYGVHSRVAKFFLQQIDKHFPRDDILQKLFNHGNMKVNHSCMSSMPKIIRRHNSKIQNSNSVFPQKKCNRRREEDCRVLDYQYRTEGGRFYYRP